MNAKRWMKLAKEEEAALIQSALMNASVHQASYLLREGGVKVRFAKVILNRNYAALWNRC